MAERLSVTKSLNFRLQEDLVLKNGSQNFFVLILQLHLVVFHTKPQIDGLPVKTQISNNLKKVVNFQAFLSTYLENRFVIQGTCHNSHI